MRYRKKEIMRKKIMTSYKVQESWVDLGKHRRTKITQQGKREYTNGFNILKPLSVER